MPKLLVWVTVIAVTWAIVWGVMLAALHDYRPAGATPDRPPASAEVDHGDEQA